MPSAKGSTLQRAMKLGVARPIYTRRRDAADLGIDTLAEVDDFGEGAGITALRTAIIEPHLPVNRPSFSILPRR